MVFNGTDSVLKFLKPVSAPGKMEGETHIFLRFMQHLEKVKMQTWKQDIKVMEKMEKILSINNVLNVYLKSESNNFLDI